ncbi:MAG: BrnT family toxin [Cyanobacteria bacterium]|nr:BrnT family toxin [Cyanobacteria bacterium CG_2015-16_32_12]NCO78409.1 BrnT family toxin [Cyanobacteria bacterium CG_2015-22_32_23]NCQ05718.1 BrnT family toxin [Cyanobacteria bacterium CG_2015-09_32_10]NCQ41633.1 BrnT family toxin [Cyanobacteria bacterium CG_2015-04_32_10]
MKVVRWNQDKNKQLIRERGISFETVLGSIDQGNLLDDYIHPNQEKYPNQRLMIVKIQNYCFLIPYVETETEIFFKTIIPSRKATKQYLDKDL